MFMHVHAFATSPSCCSIEFMALFFVPKRLVSIRTTCQCKLPYQCEDGDEVNHFTVAVIRWGGHYSQTV